MKEKAQGYILVAVISLGLAVSIVLVYAVQLTTSTSQTLNQQSYNEMAKEAANTGAAFARSCFNSGTTTWAYTLEPNKACTGSPSGSHNYIYKNADGIETTFTVNPLSSTDDAVIARGYVYTSSGSDRIEVATASSLIARSSGREVKTLAQATGEIVTEVKADQSACAIANGKLYCWGENTYGQLGVGDKNDRANPTLVSDLDGKYVTSVSVADKGACAIADGEAYCWGDNRWRQLGDGTDSDRTRPVLVGADPGQTAYNAGDEFYGKKITEISTAPVNIPILVINMDARSHSCALTDGTVYCWGNNGYRQLSHSLGCPFFACIYPNAHKPKLVCGYTTTHCDNDDTYLLTGKKSDRVAAGSHASCSVAHGQQICWGARAPINIINCTFATFQNAPGLVPLANYPCISAYSGSYNSDFYKRFTNDSIDISTWEGSVDMACSMWGAKFSCFGKHPFLGGAFLNAYAPARILYDQDDGVDITTSDNGENVDSGALVITNRGLYCVIDSGKAKCATGSVTAYTGLTYNTFPGIPPYFAPLIESPAPNGLTGKAPTRIAAGGGPLSYNYGCVVANGELLCWGNTIHGALANGSLSSRLSSATVTGRGGSKAIGTNPNTYAASGPVASGDGHACGQVNGNLYCWGKNNAGQVGIGSVGGNIDQPTSLDALLDKSITKVVAGDNHTCAIAIGKLYCWGDNEEGQLGLGNTSGRRTAPTLVPFFNNLRVTDVAAGGENTCAIANGKAYCWGKNDRRQIGRATSGNASTGTPTIVNGQGQLASAMAATAVTVGTDHACAVAHGNGFCWGSNDDGRTGIGTGSGQAPPTLITGGGMNTVTNSVTPAFTKISAGNGFTCAIVNSFTYCWGRNNHGQLGTNDLTSRSVPTKIHGTPGTLQANAVSAGGDHTCAILQGRTYCWGLGTKGRLGTGSQTSTRVATRIATIDTQGNDSYSMNISAGSSSTCSVTNGNILCWGVGDNNRLGKVGDPGNKLLPTLTSNYKYVSTKSSTALGPTF